MARDDSGKFIKGKSGNPSGRPTGSKGISMYIKEKTNNLTELIDLAYTLLYDDKTKTTDKITLINLLLCRALGTPQQFISDENSLDIKIGLPDDAD